MDHRKENAHLIHKASQSRIEIAELSLRPYRLAFLLDLGLSITELLELIRYNTSIWGGQTNFLFPLRDNLSSTFWWSSIVDLDPDIVVSASEIPGHTLSLLQKELQPFSVEKWDSRKVSEHHSLGFDRFQNVVMRYVLFYLYDEMRPIERSIIRILKPNTESSLFTLCAGAQFGIVENDVSDFMKDALNAELVELSSDGVGEYLASIEAFRGMFHPLQLTRHGLRVNTGIFPGMLLGVVIVLVSEESLVEDLCLFWNLRASGQPIATGLKEILALPLKAVSSEDGVSALGKWLEEHIEGCNLITLASAGAGFERLDEFRQLLQKQLASTTNVDLWWDNFNFPVFRVEHEPTTSEVRIDDSQVTASLPQPRWSNKVRSGMEWILDVSLGQRSTVGPGTGFVPPKFDGLNYLLAGEPDENIWKYMQPPARESHGQISIRVRPDQSYFKFNVPDSQRLFDCFLENAGYSGRITDKSRYARGMIHLLGGEEGITILQDSGIRFLLEEMASRSKSYRPEKMYKLIQSTNVTTNYKEKEHLYQLIREFSQRGIFLRGYRIRCPVCDLSRWYDLKDISEKMPCAGCLTTIQPDLEAEFHYRLNELFARGIIQGSIPLLLTIRLLSSIATQSFLYLPGIEINRDDDKLDLDALCFCNGITAIAESKSLVRGVDSETISDISNQLRKVASFGDELGAEIIVLGILIDDVPEELLIELDRLRNNTPRLTIRLFCKEDLERGYPITIINDKEKMITLQDLRPDRQEESIGRDQPPGDRKIGIGGGTWTQTIH